jgi:hypothetical protein
MEVLREKGVATAVVFPMLDIGNPELYQSGLTVADTAYYLDLPSPTPTSLAITDTVAEIGSTGMYWLELTGAEMNHDIIAIKLEDNAASDTGAEQMVIINCTRPALEDSAQEALSSDPTYGDLLRASAAVLAAESSGGGSGTIVFRDLADTKNRVVANVDANGNRTTLTTFDGT